MLPIFPLIPAKSGFSLIFAIFDFPLRLMSLRARWSSNPRVFRGYIETRAKQHLYWPSRGGASVSLLQHPFDMRRSLRFWWFRYALHTERSGLLNHRVGLQQPDETEKLVLPLVSRM